MIIINNPMTGCLFPESTIIGNQKDSPNRRVFVVVSPVVSPAYEPANRVVFHGTLPATKALGSALHGEATPSSATDAQGHGAVLDKDIGSISSDLQLCLDEHHCLEAIGR